MMIELSISNAGSRSIYTPPTPLRPPLPAPLSSRGVPSRNLLCIKPLRKSHLICTSQASSYSGSSSKPSALRGRRSDYSPSFQIIKPMQRYCRPFSICRYMARRMKIPDWSARRLFRPYISQEPCGTSRVGMGPACKKTR
jgi:hypothetical protein